MEVLVPRRRVAVAVTALAVLISLSTSVRPAAASPVVRATFPVADGAEAVAAFGSVWVLTAPFDDRSTLVRIDPGTDRIVGRYPLPGNGVGLAAGFGSLWVSQYAEDEVLRIDPASGRVRGIVRVGLQPETVRVAFGSVWVANHHGRSLGRIDPATDRVVARVPVGDQGAFRDGPQDITSDGTYLYVGASNEESVTTVDPLTNQPTDVWRTGTDAFCGDLRVAGGHLWSVDHCTNTLAALDVAGRHVARSIAFGFAPVQSEAVADGVLWVAYDRAFDDETGTASGGTLQARDPQTGAVRRSLRIGGDASTVRALAGDLWVIDVSNRVVRRLHVPT